MKEKEQEDRPFKWGYLKEWEDEPLRNRKTIIIIQC